MDIWACGIVYYCLHFQELPWRIAQPSDPLYATYSAACLSSVASLSSCPPTISNLSPRACRPLLRRMLDPVAKSRWYIEDVMRYAWVDGVQVCHLIPQPTHIHVHCKTVFKSSNWCFFRSRINFWRREDLWEFLWRNCRGHKVIFCYITCRWRSFRLLWSYIRSIPM